MVGSDTNEYSQTCKVRSEVIFLYQHFMKDLILNTAAVELIYLNLPANYDLEVSSMSLKVRPAVVNAC